MKVVNIEDVPLVERPHVREGTFRSRTLLTGAAGTPGNFSLQLVSLPGSYDSPRHRHNFDQVRYQLEGDFDFGPDGRMHPGTLGYFPEGTHYGPQTSRAASTTLVLQFGGASGSGYISAVQYAAAQAQLEAGGSFAGGVYTRSNPAGGRLNQDAYEAIWEQVNGRKLAYPPQRYAKPVFIQPENFAWVSPTGQKGVSHKPLGVFSERLTRLALYRLERAAELRLDGNSLYFVNSGSGTLEGRRFSDRAAFHVEPGEAAGVQAEQTCEILQVGLPHFA